MIELYISLAIIAVAVAMVFLFFKGKDKTKKWILSSLGVVFFGIFFYQLFSSDVLDSVVGGVMNSDINITSAELYLVTFLRWFFAVGILLCLTSCFVRVRTIDNLIAFFLPIVIILNIIFFRLNMVAMEGNAYSLFGLRSMFFALQIVMMSAFATYYLVKRIKEKSWSNWKSDLKWASIILPLVMLAVFPVNLLWTLIGLTGITAEDFSSTHRIYIYIAFLVPLLLTVFFKNKDYDVRRSVCVAIAIAGFMQYFYDFAFTSLSPTNLPFHLCNTAIILVFLAFLFNWKGMFYFTYLINVIGSLFAIVMPNNSGDIATIGTMTFWFNHWIAFFAPLLGITLKIFQRPNFKLVRGAIYIFTGYMIFAIILNAWMNNYSGNVDYFFLNHGGSIVDKFGFLNDILIQYTATWNMFGLTWSVHWLYDIIIFAAYILLIFLIWIIYAYCYKVADHYAELKNLYAVDLLGIKNLKKEMKGRKITEPYDLEGVNMIKISHFCKRYGSNKNYTVKDLSLVINDGEIFGFLGHNGSGKSTTIKSMVGIQSITEGTINICGYDIAKQPLQAKRLIGYVSDNHAVYEHLTGREYINYVADLYEVNEHDRKERMDKYVEMFNLTDAIDREIKGYSHGMKQKVTVIASLIHDPKVWILDEPLTGLDPTSAYQIKECMREHARRGNIVFFSSHVIEVVEKICDRIAIISRGRLRGVYSLADLREKGIELEDLYLSFINVGDDDSIYMGKDKKLTKQIKAEMIEGASEIRKKALELATEKAKERRKASKKIANKSKKATKTGTGKVGADKPSEKIKATSSLKKSSEKVKAVNKPKKSSEKIKMVNETEVKNKKATKPVKKESISKIKKQK